MLEKEINLLLWIQNTFRNEKMDSFWYGLTVIGNYWIWHVINILLILNPNTRELSYIIWSAVGIEVLVVHVLFKKITNQPRPFEINNRIILIGKLPKDKSFPSGHTCVAFVCSILYLIYLPTYFSLAMFVTACLIAFSRLYLGVHYPRDVFLGIIIAVLIDFVIVVIF